MKKRLVRLFGLSGSSVCALAICAFGLASGFATPAQAEVSQKDFNQMLEKYLETAEGQQALGQTVEKYFKKRQEEARKEQADKQKAELEEQFKNPVKIDVGTSPTKGAKDAEITIIEFSDFQCPYCSRANETIEQVMKKYDGKVKLAFKNLPLPFHKEADPAARAALAAGKQGKFWEMHDKLFENQKKLNTAFYEKAAKDLGLDVAKFKKDMESEDVKKQIKEDTKIAEKHGIRGTPGFSVNGVLVRGAYPADHFEMIIDRWLKKG